MYFKSKWTTLATVGREIIEDAEGVSVNNIENLEINQELN